MKKKSLIVTLLLVVGLFSITIGVTFAFFNYTRTGGENTLNVGRIAFNSTEDNLISLSNIFPANRNNLNSTNSDTVTINITGDTTYTGGIEYKVTIEDVNNTINGKEIPISFNITASNLGTKSNDYWNTRGSTTNVYNLVETGEVEDGKYIFVGYIKPDQNGVNGSIDITAYIDTDKVAISDTKKYGQIELLGYDNGTNGDWTLGRQTLTTEEWNSFASNPLSFKVKVEANEGVWVEEEQYNVLKNLNGITSWTNIRANITSIEFHKDGVAPANYVASFDATDITSAGPVTVYTVDDGSGNNTYKAIVVSDDTIYAPENSSGLFAGMTYLTTFNSKNFMVNNVTNMQALFNKCNHLTNIDSLSQWNTSNVVNMYGTFNSCSMLKDIGPLTNWNTESVTTMRIMFRNCEGLESVYGLRNWDVSRVEDTLMMFTGCVNLGEIDLSKWRTSSLTNMDSMFGMWNTDNTQRLDSKLRSIILSNKFDTSKVTDMTALFANNPLLEDINSLSYLNTTNVLYMQQMFYNCSNLTNFSALSNWGSKTGKVKNMSWMFGMGTDSNYSSVFDASVLESWNTSSVTDMSGMFLNRSLNSYYPLRNWDVSNVENFSGMFNSTSASPITTLSGLENWDVRNTITMSGMFQDNVSLVDASAINNWNINSSIDFTKMFYHDSVHPVFTKVSGTWDENGTFTPNA